MGEGIGGEKKKKKEKNERKRRRRKGERRKRERKIQRLLPLIYRRSDNRSSSSRELKSVCTTRAMLQEVGNLVTLAYFHPKGCLVVFSTKGAVWPDYLLGCPMLTLHSAFSLGLVFDWET